MKVIEIHAPASKSMSHRALICAALSGGACEVHDTLVSVDLAVTRRVLEDAGARFQDRDGVLKVQGFEDGPAGAPLDDPTISPVHTFMAESGTSCRLLTGVLAAGKGRFYISGAERMHERPIGELTDALTRLGPQFTFDFRPGYPPFVLTTEGLRGGETSITLENSSQYLSGLLLAAPLAEGPVAISVGGTKSVSWPYVALTLKAMEDFGAKFSVQRLLGNAWKTVPWRSLTSVEPGKVRFVVEPSGYQPADYRVEADWSNASYFLAAGAVGKAPVHMAGVRADSLQGDRAILKILQQMGARVEADFDGVTVFPTKLTGADLDMSTCPDLVPTVSAMAAFAEGPTTITGVAHLRIKECDRLAAMVAEVARTGCETEDLEDGLKVTPRAMSTGKKAFNTYGDHRIAMSTALFELAGIQVGHDNPDCVTKSFPTFFDEWAKIREGNGVG